MNQPIVFVSGSKGGVGKSITAMPVLDYLGRNTATYACIRKMLVEAGV